MTTIPELQAKMAKLPINLDRLDGIVNGPASGVGSTVTTDAGDVVTFARLILEVGYGPILRDLSDVDTVNAFLAANAGQTIHIMPHASGAHNPNFLETGYEFIVPANTIIKAVGIVRINSDNPTRGVFRIAGSWSQIVGAFYFVGLPDRIDPSAKAGTYNTWATAWNAAYPAYQIPSVDWATKDWKIAWNDAIAQSQFEAFGAMNSAGRMSAIWSYDADYILVDGPHFDNFHTCVNLQGRNIIGTSSADTNSMQTEGNVVRNILGDRFDFVLLFKKQRNFVYDNIVSIWVC